MGLKSKFETAMVNEPLVFEALKFYLSCFILEIDQQISSSGELFSYNLLNWGGGSVVK